MGIGSIIVNPLVFFKIEDVYSVKDLKPTRLPETGNLYPGSVIDNLATVRRVGDCPEPKISLKCLKMHSDNTIFLKIFWMEIHARPRPVKVMARDVNRAPNRPRRRSDIYYIQGGSVLNYRSPVV